VIRAEAETFRKPRRPGNAFSRHVIKNSNKHDDRQEANDNDGDKQQRNGLWSIFVWRSLGCGKNTVIC